METNIEARIIVQGFGVTTPTNPRDVTACIVLTARYLADILRAYLSVQHARHASIPLPPRDDEQRCRCPGTCDRELLAHCHPGSADATCRNPKSSLSRPLHPPSGFTQDIPTSKHPPSPRWDLSTLPMRLGISSHLFPIAIERT
jgi:hypothetical protein